MDRMGNCLILPDVYAMVRTGHLTESPVLTIWLLFRFPFKESGPQLVQESHFLQVDIDKGLLKGNHKKKKSPKHSVSSEAPCRGHTP